MQKQPPKALTLRLLGEQGIQMGALFVFSIPSPGAKSPSRILSKLQRLHATQSQCGTERWMPDKSNEESSPKDFLKAFARTNADFFDIFQKIPTFCLKQNKPNPCTRILVRYMWHLPNFVVCFLTLETLIGLNQNLFQGKLKPSVGS